MTLTSESEAQTGDTNQSHLPLEAGAAHNAKQSLHNNQFVFVMLLYKGRKYWMYVHIGYKLPARSQFICQRDGAGMLLEFSKQSRICVPTAVGFNLSFLSCRKTLTTTDWRRNNTGLTRAVKRPQQHADSQEKNPVCVLAGSTHLCVPPELLSLQVKGLIGGCLGGRLTADRKGW